MKTFQRQTAYPLAEEQPAGRWKPTIGSWLEQHQLADLACKVVGVGSVVPRLDRRRRPRRG